MTTKRKKKLFFVGIKGVGMAALAVWAKEKGWEVSGSDTAEDFPTSELLKRNHIKVQIGFEKKNLPPDADIVVVTGAHGGKRNPQALEAMHLGIPTMMQGEALAKFSQDKKVIAVAGTHGKTTTSALTAHLLSKAHKDPSYIVGCGDIPSLGSPAHAGKGEYFVVEADEYINCPSTDKTPKFLFFKQYVSLITNIEFDHPDVYKDLADVEKAFATFVKHTKDNGVVIGCVDNTSVTNLFKKLPHQQIIGYGEQEHADYLLQNLSFSLGKTNFSIKHGKETLGPFVLTIPGKHNALNALGAAIAAHHAGLSWEEIHDNLSSFAGTKRRFEFVASLNEVKFYDDYAHHPSEIVATLRAAREWFPKSRIIAIFQPHTFSRTKMLFDDFTKAFKDADVAVIADIYPSAREPVDAKFSSKILVEAMKLSHGCALYRPTKAGVVDYIAANLRAGDVIFTLGAGDIYTWTQDIIAAIKQR